MKRIFNNSELDDIFEKDGYITTKLLENTEFEQLEQLSKSLTKEYMSSDKSTDSEYDLSFFSQSPEVKEKIFNELWQFFAPHIQKILPNYEPLIVNMFNKMPGTGEVPIHQNWTFVDEDKYTSVSVWIPLCDVSRENGTLEVVPGTHVNVSQYRSPTIPWAFQGLEYQIKHELMVPLELSKGEVGIIDDAVIHFSNDNYSNKNRPTIQLILKPKEAKAIHYLGNNQYNPTIKIYEVDANFFRSFDMNEDTIDGKLLGEKHISHRKLTEAELFQVAKSKA